MGVEKGKNWEGEGRAADGEEDRLDILENNQRNIRDLFDTF